MEGDWSCYGEGQFKGGRIIATKVASLKGGRTVVTQVVSLIGENSYVTEVVTLMEGEWSCYRSGRFNGSASLNEGEWLLQRWPEGE